MSAALPAMATAISAISPVPQVYLHVALFLANGRTLGDETFRLVSFQGEEGISQAFDFQLELHGNTSAEHGTALSFDDVVGCPVTAGIHYPALNDSGHQPTRAESNQWFQDALGGTDESTRLAFFNGIVGSFTMERPGVYRVGMRPALWKLTLTNHYRVLQHMSVRDAIEALLKPLGIAYSVDALVGTGNLAVSRVQDWLQAGESDYDLLARLMAKAHVYYFFTTTAKAHTVVFANRPAYPAAIANGTPLRYCATGEEDLGLAQPDTIVDYRFQQSLTSTAVNAVFTREEAAWEMDPVATYQSFRSNTRDDPGQLPFHQYMVYQYGCSDTEVDHFASDTQDALDASGREFGGTSFCPFLRCGHQFATTQLPRADQWPTQVAPALEGKRWVLRQVEHHASLDGAYQNRFGATDASSLVTPFSLQETQQGVVLARVVAHDSGTAPTDWRFFQKSAFDAETAILRDSDGVQQQLSAQGVCVVFSTDLDGAAPVWIKLGASMQTAPEIGALVLVARTQDQSELPEIQNIIAADGTMVVKPSRWTASTHVGSSYSTAYGDGQSIRFGLNSPASLPTATGIVTTQYATGQFRETSYAMGATYSYATADGGTSGLLSKSDSYGSAYSTHHGAVNSSTTVFDSMDSTSTVNGTSTSTSTIGTSNSTSTVGTSTTTSTVTGTSTTTTNVGASSSFNHIGASSDMSVTGASSRMSLTGSTSDISVVPGLSSSVSMTGASSSFALKGTSSSIDITSGPSLSVQLASTLNTMQTKGTEIDIPILKIFL